MKYKRVEVGEKAQVSKERGVGCGRYLGVKQSEKGRKQKP